MGVKKKLVIYTLGFPFGSSEQSFLNPEIQELSARFKKIYIVPSSMIGPLSSLPDNVEVLKVSNTSPISAWRLIKNLLKVLLGDLNQHALLVLKWWKEYLRSVKNLTNRQAALVKVLNEKSLLAGDVIHYSYWLSDWATILAITKELKNTVRISRTHRFDLYEERSEYGFLFFHRAQLKSLNFILPISEMGKGYLVNKYPQFADKIILSRLGSPSNSKQAENLNSETFRIQSCSNLIPLKRVGLIVETLAKCKSKIHWTHIGDGKLEENLKAEARNLPANISFEFLGRLAWDKVRDYYSNEYIDLFLHLSESEGIPVSIMEAISTGTPVFACDVGGVSEIIPDSSNLLSPTPNTDDLAKKIDDFFISGSSRNAENRALIKAFWLENFSAEANFRHFSDELLKLKME